MRKRIAYLDNLRVFSLCLMILLHVASSQMNNVLVGSFNWQVFNIYTSLSRCCVPLFVMISGALMLDLEKETSFQRIIKHNILRIIMAFLVWSIAYAMLSDLLLPLYKHESISISSFIQAIFAGPYHFWFLFKIVGLYLMTPFIKAIIKDEQLEWYLVVGSFFTCFVVNFINIGFPFLASYVNQFGLSLFSGYLGYYVLGHFLASKTLNQKNKNIINILAVASILITIIGTAYLSNKYGYSHQALYANLSLNTYFVSIAVFVLFKEHFAEANEKVMKLAKYAFGIYLVHEFVLIVLGFVNVTTLSFNSLISVPSLTLVVCLISYLIIFIIAKIPVLKDWII